MNILLLNFYILNMETTLNNSLLVLLNYFFHQSTVFKEKTLDLAKEQEFLVTEFVDLNLEKLDQEMVLTI